MKNILVDKISLRIEEFLPKYLEETINESIKELSEKKKLVKLPFDDIEFLTSYGDSKIESNKLAKKIENICNRKCFWQFLLIFRRIQYVGYHSFKNLYIGRRDPEMFNSIFEQATFIGTNFILKYSMHNMSLESCNDRYHFTPSDDDLKDSIKIMIFSLFYCHNQFYINSMARKPLSSSITVGSLIDIYNERLRRIVKYFPSSDINKDSILMPGFLLEPINSPKRILEVKNEKNVELCLFVKNYIPKQSDSVNIYEKFKYLNNSNFEKKMGISFEKWWKIWITINSLLKHSLLFFFSDSYMKTLSKNELMGAAEKADDYSDSCLGCAEISSFLNTCHNWLKARYKEFAPSYEDCETFFNKLCFDAPTLEPSFIEQPFLFYKVGSNRFFWDYLRHGNLLNAICRMIDRRESGKQFEKMVRKRLSQEVKGITEIKSNLTITGDYGEKDWEIDLMFYFENIVFIVETKHHLKSPSYHLGKNGAVSNRIQEKELELEKQDRNLKKYQERIPGFWENIRPKGAICILCTLEVEFISSFEMKYWLINGKIPRICTADELVKFFQMEDCTQLINHPGFVKFG